MVVSVALIAPVALAAGLTALWVAAVAEATAQSLSVERRRHHLRRRREAGMAVRTAAA